MGQWTLISKLVSFILTKIERKGNTNKSIYKIVAPNSSVIRQKGESQKGCFMKAKHAEISEKQTFLTPCYVA